MKTEHRQIWDTLYPQKTEARDYTGRLMKKEAYGQVKSDFGWVIELINPNKSATIENVHIVSVYANAIRDGRTSFVIDGKNYQLQRHDGKSTIVQIKQAQVQDIWKKVFGNRKEGVDFCGRAVHKDKGDWNRDHIMPIAKGGTNAQSNLQIVHIDTNKEKEDKTTFHANGKTYQVRKNKDSLEEENKFYDYSGCDYCILELEQEKSEVQQTASKKLSRMDFWRHEFEGKKTAMDYDDVPISAEGDWIIELLNPDGNWVVSNTHIVAKRTNNERAGRPNFSIYDSKNRCECYYRLRRNEGELNKNQMSKVYDYSEKDYYIERYDIIHDDDEDDDYNYYD
jgi:hypothetical protein